MVEGKCIYCKKVKKLNEEHAFPKALLQKRTALDKRTPEWIIYKLCEECNGKLGKLDEILVTKGPMAFIWRIIKSEWNADNVCNSQNAAFYNEKKYGILPVRLVYPDPLYDNLTILHEETDSRPPGSRPTLLGRARVPQIVLTQHTDEQTAEQVVLENCEKWAAGDIREAEFDEYEDVYILFGNTYVFGPKATKYFVAGIEREQEFMSKFVKKHEYLRYALTALFPNDPNDAGKLNGFCKRLNASGKAEIEARRIEPKESTENFVMVAAEKKAIPFIKRAIAKIAFHSFLYWHPKFSGHEPIFEGIRTFILRNRDDQTSNGEDFVTGLNVPGRFVWSSNEHLHIFLFYADGDNIICQIVFFTGLLLDSPRSKTPELLANEIILAGNSEKARLGSLKERSLPFYVHGKSQMKRRIVPVNSRIVPVRF